MKNNDELRDYIRKNAPDTIFECIPDHLFKYVVDEIVPIRLRKDVSPDRQLHLSILVSSFYPRDLIQCYVYLIFIESYLKPQFF